MSSRSENFKVELCPWFQYSYKEKGTAFEACGNRYCILSLPSNIHLGTYLNVWSVVLIISDFKFTNRVSRLFVIFFLLTNRRYIWIRCLNKLMNKKQKHIWRLKLQTKNIFRYTLVILRIYSRIYGFTQLGRRMTIYLLPY